jgi:glycogen operon protein
MTILDAQRPTATRPGQRAPLGATPLDGGTNFAVVSNVADGVLLCLFDDAGQETQIRLEDFDAGVWHGFVAGVGPGQAYGYRVLGGFEPERGVRSNPAKLLLDPYARATTGAVIFGPEVRGDDPADPAMPSLLDSAPQVPRSLIVDRAFDWGPGTRPAIRYADMVVYEVHVKGFTMAHPDVPPELRGTFAGFGHEAAIAHLVDLGVTTVELLPVHQNVPESFLVERGLTNYWGYNTIGFFAPHEGYSATARAGRRGGQVAEFKAMVRALHEAGLEVILDVVYNHTAEGDQKGPTLCHRGLDNPAYYRLDPHDPRHYVDTTGCGNALNADDAYCLQLIMDSLRYWLTEMRVDGFRFDLAPTLAREAAAFDRSAAFFDLVAQDPVVGQAKLIAEPWDVGQPDSYDIGRFPPLWSEWNGKYRDTMRDFWRRRDGMVPEFATRFSGSSDLYGGSRRRPTASVNLITVHDGFTLADLVSHDHKHNEANGESNRDGTDDNRSWNCGAEGPTDDPEILALRARQSRAMLTTLLLSFGVPMVLGGDELGRTQHGNNNAYCQDNETTWFDWSNVDRDLMAFTQRLITLRRTHPVFRRRRFLVGLDAQELRWFTPSGTPMTSENWADPGARCLVIYLDGDDAPDRADTGELLVDDEFLVLVNGWWEPLEFTIPDVGHGRAWREELETFDAAPPSVGAALATGDHLTLGPQSISVLRSPTPRDVH